MSPIVEPLDPLDANPKVANVRIGQKLRQELERIASSKHLSLAEVIVQVLKWGAANKDIVPPRNPLDLNPKNLSFRVGAQLKKRLEEIAATKRMTTSELINEFLKLGIIEDKK